MRKRNVYCSFAIFEACYFWSLYWILDRMPYIRITFSATKYNFLKFYHVVTKICFLTALLFLYLPIAALGYVVYGGGKNAKNEPYLESSIISSLPNTPMKSAIEVLLSLHLFFAFLLVINAPAQEFEEFFKVPKRKFSASLSVN